ncbi:NAD-dependent epimerase/dehydratase family protein [Spinactinospora alkalitolerans]
MRNLSEVLDHPRFRFVECDLRITDVTALLQDVSTVFHLAGVSGVRESWGARFEDYATVNLVGTQRILEACCSAGVQRVVLASSSSVYGSAPGGSSRVSDLPVPVSPYGVSKLAAERLALAYGARTGVPFDVLALRYFTVYGPRQRSTMLMARILDAAFTQQPMTLFGDGSQRRHFTFVGDAVAATVMAGTCSLADSIVVNVAGPRSITISDVIAAAEQATGRTIPLRFEANRAGDVEASEADLQLTRSVLGYEPRVDLGEGITRHWDWYLRTGRRPTASRRSVAVAGGEQ